MKRVIFWHVLYVVFQRRFRQYEPLLVDLVHGILEGQFRTAILLVMSEYSTWNQSTINRSETMIPSAWLNMIFAIAAENFPIKIHSFRANILKNLLTPLIIKLLIPYQPRTSALLYIISKARSFPSLISIISLNTNPNNNNSLKMYPPFLPPLRRRCNIWNKPSHDFYPRLFITPSIIQFFTRPQSGRCFDAITRHGQFAYRGAIVHLMDSSSSLDGREARQTRLLIADRCFQTEPGRM